LPAGGEFGEYAAETVRLEFGEEIGEKLTDVRLASVLESIFEWGGTMQHEIVFVFLAGFADPTAYEIPEQSIRDARKATRVIWRLRTAEHPPFYPLGIAGVRCLKAAARIPIWIAAMRLDPGQRVSEPLLRRTGRRSWMDRQTNAAMREG
jgi:hypothetical protein